MMRKLIVIAAICALVAFSFAYAAPSGGQTTFGGSEQGTGSTATTVNAEGGNVSYVNVSGTAITGRWAGFYGNVSGGVELQDSSSNTFYSWTVSNLSGAVVYVANGSVTDWGSANIVPLNSSTGTEYPTFLQTDTTDNYNNTFGSTGTFTSASLSEPNTNFTTTTGGLVTYALRSVTDDRHIWAGVVQDNVAGFNSDILDYQILAPADSSGITYTFYLELP